MINMRGLNKQTRSTCARLFFLFQLSIRWTSVVSMSTELPCHFLDSINITDGTFQPNKSILYGGTVYPEGQYAEIDYILNEKGENEIVKLYRRGCLCSLKPCIRICCTYFDCPIGSNKSSESYESMILDANNNSKLVRLDQQFGIINENPCPTLYFEEDKIYQITHVSSNNISENMKKIKKKISEWCLTA